MIGAVAMPDPLRRLLEALAERVPGDRICEVAADSLLGGQAALTEETYARRQRVYSVALGAVAFAGTLSASQLPSELYATARTRRMDLLGIAYALHGLEVGGRAVLVVSEDLLSAATQAHRAMRRRLIEDHALQAVIRLGHGWYKPRTRAAILVLRKGGSTDWIWFCDVPARREPKGTRARNDDSALGATGEGHAAPLTDVTLELIDVVARWETRTAAERDRPRDGASFCVPRAELAPPAFDFNSARYRRIEPSATPVVRPHELLTEIAGLEAEIFHGIRQLVSLLKP